MCEAAAHPADIPDPLARADQLEREITDLCARIDAACYRLLQLIAELARHATAAQLEKLVRAYRRVERVEECRRALTQQAARELHHYHDDNGDLVIRARLPAEQGETVLRALDAAMDARRATAGITARGDSESGHVSAETLAGDGNGRSELESGQRLAVDSSRRIACDASLLRITGDDTGNPLDRSAHPGSGAVPGARVLDIA